MAGCVANVCRLRPAPERSEDEFDGRVVIDECKRRSKRNRDAAFELTGI